ncbi:MAG: hypothetical protein KDB53_01285 [Planctomycetes bacterium]|nr:hypothetical protein [Planctomycetota bacterium]
MLRTAQFAILMFALVLPACQDTKVTITPVDDPNEANLVITLLERHGVPDAEVRTSKSGRTVAREIFVHAAHQSVAREILEAFNRPRTANKAIDDQSSFAGSGNSAERKRYYLRREEEVQLADSLMTDPRVRLARVQAPLGNDSELTKIRNRVKKDPELEAEYLASASVFLQWFRYEESDSPPDVDRIRSIVASALDGVHANRVDVLLIPFDVPEFTVVDLPKESAGPNGRITLLLYLVVLALGLISIGLTIALLRSRRNTRPKGAPRMAAGKRRESSAA